MNSPQFISSKAIEVSPKQQKIIERITDLILKRVFIIIDSKLNDQERREMEKVFASTDNKQKALFMKKYAPDFGQLLGREALQTAQRIRNRIDKK